MARNKHSTTSNNRLLLLPHWAVLFYASAAALLIPWTVYLSMTLPTRQITHNWDMVWWGFDSFVIMVMALTAYFIARRSIWVILTASSLGTCLFIDCWFDILTSRHGHDLLQSIILALFVELPVAIISWYFAINTARQYTKNNL